MNLNFIEIKNKNSWSVFRLRCIMFYFLTIDMCQVRFCFCKLKETLLRISIKFKETSYGSYRVREPDYVRNWYDQIIYGIS